MSTWSAFTAVIAVIAATVVVAASTAVVITGIGELIKLRLAFGVFEPAQPFSQ